MIKKITSLMLCALILFTGCVSVFAGSSANSSGNLNSSTSSYCYRFGDINLGSDNKFANDGITIEDARIALRGAIGLVTLTKKQITRADINQDGKVTVSDVRKILRIATDKSENSYLKHPVTTVKCVGSTLDVDSDYNILGSNTFYTEFTETATETDGASVPCIVAKNGDDVYISTQTENGKFGYMKKNGKMYMVSGTGSDMYSLEFTDTVLKAMSISKSELSSVFESMTNMLYVTNLKYAKESDETVKCPVCGKSVPTGNEIYTFTFSSYTYNITMCGKKLGKIETKGENNCLIEFSEVSSTVPSDLFDLPSQTSHKLPQKGQNATAAVFEFILRSGVSFA